MFVVTPIGKSEGEEEEELAIVKLSPSVFRSWTLSNSICVRMMRYLPGYDPMELGKLGYKRPDKALPPAEKT